jgi:hypothetical protein
MNRYRWVKATKKPDFASSVCAQKKVVSPKVKMKLPVRIIEVVSYIKLTNIQGFFLFSSISGKLV